MNNTKTISFKTFLLFLYFSVIQNPAFGQSISIDYSPPDPVCSLDTIGCTGTVGLLFSLEAENAEGITLSHQISLNGEMPVEDVFGTMSGVYPGYVISGNYPIGQHTFVVTAIQGADTLVADIEFAVVDCVEPEIECLQGGTVTLYPQPDGCCAYAVWASEIITQSVESCSDPLTFSVHRTEAINEGSEIPNMEQTGLLIECFDPVMLDLTVYAWDNAFNPYAIQPDGAMGGPNYSYCEIVLHVYDGCDPPVYSEIYGTVTTEENEGIAGVTIEIVGIDTLLSLSNADGSFSLGNLEFGPEYTITPALDINPNNGVSTFDQVLIQKHILGIQIIDSPYKMIAADVNNSGHISIFDVIQLRKLSLGIYETFPDNTSWRFVDRDYVFPDATNPWVETFPESIYIPSMYEEWVSEDFIGIKIGDVNGSVIPN